MWEWDWKIDEYLCLGVRAPQMLHKTVGGICVFALVGWGKFDACSAVVGKRRVVVRREICNWCTLCGFSCISSSSSGLARAKSSCTVVFSCLRVFYVGWRALDLTLGVNYFPFRTYERLWWYGVDFGLEGRTLHPFLASFHSTNFSLHLPWTFPWMAAWPSLAKDRFPWPVVYEGIRECALLSWFTRRRFPPLRIQAFPPQDMNRCVLSDRLVSIAHRNKFAFDRGGAWHVHRWCRCISWKELDGVERYGVALWEALGPVSNEIEYSSIRCVRVSLRCRCSGWVESGW